MTKLTKFRNFKVSHKITFLLLLLVSLSLIGAGLYTYISTAKNVESLLGRGLEHIVRTGVMLIDPEDHKKIVQGYLQQDPDLLQSSHFKRIQKNLQEIKIRNNLLSDVYTVIRPPWSPEKAIFIGMGNEKPYVGNGLKLSDLLKKVFLTGEPAYSELYKDTEGQWVSAAAPIKDSDGTVIAVLEVDYEAHSEVRRAKMDILKNIGIPAGIAIFFAILLGHLLGRIITKPLTSLTEGAERISQGNLETQIINDSKDEIGILSRTFNHMTGELNRLLSETKEKARMAVELQTARLIQETLFEKEETRIGPFHVVGHFQPASECGGDWWYYSLIENKLFLWIGDATGHGAAAAMVTSAVRSAVAIIERTSGVTPAKSLEILNRAIFETTKGRMQMTFFVGCIDLKTGKFTYSNASHNPPYVVKDTHQGRKLKKNDFQPLLECNGPRLGEKKEKSYEELEIQLRKGDILVLYSDGILDIKNQEGKDLGESGFIRSLIRSMEQGKDAAAKMSFIKTEVANFIMDTEIPDDVTVLMCQFDEDLRSNNDINSRLS